MIAQFTVYGEALSQGSMKSFARSWRDKVTGERKVRAMTTHSNPAVVSWREDIRAAIQNQASTVFFAKPTAVLVRAVFYLERPKSLPKKITKPVKGRDLDKLARAACDAMTGKLYTDDKQVTDLHVKKRFALDRPYVVFYVAEDLEFEDLAIHQWLDMPRLF